MNKTTPLTLYYNYSKDKDSVIHTIVNTENLHELYNMDLINKVMKSMCNEVNVENGFNVIGSEIRRVAKVYLTTLKEDMFVKRKDLMATIQALHLEDLNPVPEEEHRVINNLKIDKAFQEFIVQAMFSSSLDIKQINKDKLLDVANPKVIESMVSDVLSLPLFVERLPLILEHEDSDVLNIIKTRLEEISNKYSLISSDNMVIEISEEPYKTFINLHEVLDNSEVDLRDSIINIKEILKTTTKDLDKIMLELTIKIDNNNLLENDMVKYKIITLISEHVMFIMNLLTGKIEKDIVNINIVNDKFISVIKKITI